MENVNVEDFKKILSSYLDCFDVEDVASMEGKLDSCDKISLVYLLYDYPGEALQYLSDNLKSNIVTKWCEFHSKSREWKLRLIESLALMQKFNLLKMLGYKKRDLSEVKDLLSCAKRSVEFDIRKQLYATFDQLSVNEIRSVVNLIDKKVRKPVDLFTPSHIEIYLLQWQLEGRISLSPLDLNCIINALEELNLKQCLLLLEGDEHLKEECYKTERETQSTATSFPDHASSTHTYYPIINPNRVGLCIIVNQENYSCNSPHKPRFGSQTDCYELKRTMTSLKIETITLSNLPHNHIFPSVGREINDKFIVGIHSVLFVVFLAHGERDTIIGTDGKSVRTDTIRDTLSDSVCPCLKGIPKIIIFQSCRGDFHYGVEALTADGPDLPEKGNDQIKRSMEDYIICWSTIPGFKSYRHKLEGTLYIQTLCKYLFLCKDEHMFSILTKVHNEFKEKKIQILQSHGQDVGMVPEFYTSLTKDLYLCLDNHKRFS